MGALDRISPRYKNVPSVQSMAVSLDRQKKANAGLRERARGPGLFAVLVPSQVAAYLGGWLDARQPDVFQGRMQASAAAGVALAVGGVLKSNPTCLYAASALLAIQSYSAGVRMGGGDLAIVEVAPATEPVLAAVV